MQPAVVPAVRGQIRTCLRLLLLALLPLLPTSTAIAGPQRIASINLCTDQALLLLVDRTRIVSLSHLATDPDYSRLWREAKGIAANAGLAEQVIPLEPDLILANEYTSRAAIGLLRRLDHPVATVPLPDTLAQVDDFLRHVGRLVGEQARAEELIAGMHRRLDLLGPRQASQDGPSALVYAPNGHTEGAGTFKHDLLTRAGLHNAATDAGIDRYGTLAVEQVLALRPKLLVIDDSARNHDSLAQRLTAHPALAALADTRRAVVPSALWLCPGPWSVDAVELLAGAAV